MLQLILITFAFANSFVELDLKVGMEVHGTYYYQKKSKPAFRWVDKNAPVPKTNVQATAGNARFTESGTASYNLNAIFNSRQVVSNEEIQRLNQEAQEKYKESLKKYENNNRGVNTNAKKPEEPIDVRETNQFWKAKERNVRDFKVHVDIADDKGATLIKIDLEDKQKRGVEDKIRVSKRAYYQMHYGNDNLNGSIKIGYKMPENTWAVKIMRLNYEGALVSENSKPGIIGAFNGNLPMNQLEKEYLVWAKPGSDVYHEFYFNNYSVGNDVSGSFGFKVIPIKYNIDTDMNSLYDTISNAGKRFAENDFNLEENEPLLKSLLYMHSNEDTQNQLLYGLPTKDVFGFINTISNDISYFTDAEPELWNIKAAATILGHELAYKVLQDIRPYCQEQSITLPYRRTKEDVMGLMYANYFIEKSIQRISSDGLSHYERLIELLKPYEEQGLSFAQVRNNEEIALKIQRAYEVLMNSYNMRISALKAASDEVHMIYDMFGTLGGPGSETELILNLFTELNGADQEFGIRLLERIRQAQPNNQDKFVVSDLSNELEKIQNKVDELIVMMENKLSISTMSGGDVSSQFVREIQGMISTNVENLTRKHNSSFEHFRNAYFDQNKLNELLSGVNKCIQ